MMLARVLPLPVAKEVRALLPVWLGSLAVVAAAAAVGDGTPQDLGRLAYGAACAALGALSIGHEYTNRTLAMLLTQPVSRARLFLIKQSVLAVMLVTLSALAWNTVFQPSRTTAMVFILSVPCALTITPWLTMLCRNPLAGAVFTGPAPAWIWLLIGAFVDRPWKLAVFEWAVLGFCAVAAVLGWRTFMRLEAIDGQGANLFFRLKAAATREGRSDAAARTRHPIWLLVKKELGLQQLTLAIATLYFVGWLISLFGTAPGEAGEDVFGAATVLYSGQLALLVGALASAGERHLGTLEWQGLLPMASSKQWAVKVATVLALSMLLSVAWPALLLFTWGGAFRINQWYAGVMLLLTTTGLYVSSVSPSGVRALLVCLPISLGALLASAVLWPFLTWRLTPLSLVLATAFVASALYFALLNHRSSQHSAGRIALQVFVMAGCLALAAALATLTR
jgi:ABC-2 family transporter protein